MEKPIPFVRRANLAYFVLMLLLVTLGSIVQRWSLGLGLVITELCLILLPTLLIVRLEKQDIRETLRLRWPGWRLALLGLVVGAGLWPLAALIEAAAAWLFGYTPPSPFAGMPTDPLNLAALWISFAVLAPLCEESLFRGYLLSAYQRQMPKAAVLIVSLLFAFFHLRLQGLLALLPISFALTFMVRRSNSLVPGVLAHFAYNAMVGSLAIAVAINPKLISADNLPLVAVVCSVALTAPLFGFGALWLFRRMTPSEGAPESTPAASPRLAAAWPLIGAAVVFLVFGGLEFVNGRFPQLLAQRDLVLQAAPWTQPVSLTYELRDPLEQAVGEATCQITPAADEVAFDCQTDQHAFETRVLASTYISGAYTALQAGHWQKDNMHLLNATLEFNSDTSTWSATIKPVDGKMRLDLLVKEAPAGQLVFTPTVLVDREWYWRLAALPFGKSFFFGGRTGLAWPLHWSAVEQRDLPHVQTTYVLMKDQERLSTPLGSRQAWKVMVEKESAWYDVTPPHHLLKLDNGAGVTYVLTAIK
jgi:membrane protease YdiL (CAAX protease family)